MAPSSFTAGDKILGYKTASLNRVFESSPGELQLPEQATWRLFAAQKWERGSTLGCFQIFFVCLFVFCLLPKQWNEKFKLFHQVVFSSVFLFSSSRAFKICIFLRMTIILRVLWSWEQNRVVRACVCGYFVFPWHPPRVPVQSLHCLCTWQPNYLNAAAPRKLSVVHCTSHKKWSFIFDPGFASNFQWQSKRALKTLVHSSC